MAFVTGGKHFGQYTYEHWFDDEYGNKGEKDMPKAGSSMKLILKNFRIVDEETDMDGSLVIENGIIGELMAGQQSFSEDGAAIIMDGKSFVSSGNLPVIMPAFVDLHAHFRESGSPEKEIIHTELIPPEVSLPSEVLESASMAAAAGGFGTVVCMANTRPPTDTIKQAAAVKSRCDTLGFIDLYPVISLTKGMEGKELSEISCLPGKDTFPPGGFLPLMLSEDGKDLSDDSLFLAAMEEAKRIGIPVSCHCDHGGDEHSAVRRVIELGKAAGCHIHIAHVSKKDTVDLIRREKAEAAAKADSGFTLTCEVMPHNLCLTVEDARKLGEKSWGRVNPPLASEEDRQALISALADGTIDVIATDHAPHRAAGKEAGAPGFSGFETAFAAVYTELVRGGVMNLKRLSALMSANPSRLLGFGGNRGRILPGYRADLAVIDIDAPWTVDPSKFKSRGRNSAFAGEELFGRILMTIHKGRVVHS